MLTETERLILDRPRCADADGLHQICSDPRVWTHFPSLRHTDVEQTQMMLGKFIAVWDLFELGPWVVKSPSDQSIIGYGGCSIKEDAFWNLGYRLAFDAQGQGLATELSREAIKAAKLSRPELPIVAYLLEHNVASARLAEKVGLTLVHRGIDAGNPDTQAIRLVYADRELSADELTKIMG